ncbi:MAG TPA: DNA methyltransferase [Anaerolineales bacterium]|nr:DNA methyltransferase [Anaerolineales bacterium]
MLTTDLLTIKEASDWATHYIGKTVTSANISYLIQYGRIPKINEQGFVKISKQDLLNYYEKQLKTKESLWKLQLGEDLNWALSFEQFKESETTKHVHRLHPYKGKFIPQLVEYFLDDHIDQFKTTTYFQKGDIVLDPFSGSGTTMVQSCELGIHAIGIDISAFNAMIGNCKITKYQLTNVQVEINRINHVLKEFISQSRSIEFEEKLLQALNQFNNLYFPSSSYKYKLRQGEIDENVYGSQKERAFLPIYYSLLEQYNIQLLDGDERFLDKWYFQQIKDEINLIFGEIKKISNPETKKILALILSRTIRSCRATTHADLATLVEPIKATYYCAKHGKICKPIFSILKWWETYTKDTVKRLVQFDQLRTATYQLCLSGDSREMDIHAELEQKNPAFANLVQTQKIKGIFSSPPYVGLIDYHEQHAYAYDLFGFERRDNLEIGALYKGQGKEAKQSYIQGISQVLNNCKKFLVDDFHIFLVANDKYNLYPEIAKNAKLEIVNQFKRPVLNRTEKDKGAYSEIIFHLRKR